MVIEEEDRTHFLWFYRAIAKGSQLTLDESPNLSAEAKAWVTAQHDYAAKCHKLLLKRKMVLPDQPDDSNVPNEVFEEVSRATARINEAIKGGKFPRNR